jgi:hypothetical protein
MRSLMVAPHKAVIPVTEWLGPRYREVKDKLDYVDHSWSRSAFRGSDWFQVNLSDFCRNDGIYFSC